MEFPFNIQEIFPGNHPVCQINCRLEVANCDSLLNAKQTRSKVKETSSKEPLNRNWKNLCEVINCMGDASAKAQGLLTSITTGEKLLSSQHHLYLLTEGNYVVGILKVGVKRLFVVDAHGCLHECMALCILDFYVQEQRQRRGHGKKLFDTMLQVEGKCPEELAIDRPSPKLIGFLQKHYNLTRAIKQANNFVVFDTFFPASQSERGSAIPRQRHSFCAVEDQNASPQAEKVTRPHSLGGISGCTWWPNTEEGNADSSPSGRRRNVDTKERSLSSASSRESFTFSPKLSSHLNRSSSSSWNIFGVLPPDYLEQEPTGTDRCRSGMS